MKISPRPFTENFFIDNTLKMQSLGNRPTQPLTIWDSDDHPDYKSLETKIISGGIHVFSSGERTDILRFTLSVAHEIAKVKLRATPRFEWQAIKVSEEGKLVTPSAPRKVLYLNTLTAQRILENELVGLYPDLENWLASKKTMPHPHHGLDIELLQTPLDALVDLAPSLRDKLVLTGTNCIILNSFEFAVSTERKKRDLIHILKDINERFGVTIIIMTRIPNERIEPKITGPYAELRMLADSSTISDLPSTKARQQFKKVKQEAEPVPADNIFNQTKSIEDLLRSYAERNEITKSHCQSSNPPTNTPARGASPPENTDDPEGALSNDLEGALSNDPEGALSNDPEGALSNDPEGALSNDPEGALSNDPEGVFSGGPEGAVSDDPEGVFNDDPEGAQSDDPEGALVEI